MTPTPEWFLGLKVAAGAVVVLVMMVRAVLGLTVKALCMPARRALIGGRSGQR